MANAWLGLAGTLLFSDSVAEAKKHLSEARKAAVAVAAKREQPVKDDTVDKSIADPCCTLAEQVGSSLTSLIQSLGNLAKEATDFHEKQGTEFGEYRKRVKEPGELASAVRKKFSSDDVECIRNYFARSVMPGDKNRETGGVLFNRAIAIAKLWIGKFDEIGKALDAIDEYRKERLAHWKKELETRKPKHESALVRWEKCNKALKDFPKYSDDILRKYNSAVEAEKKLQEAFKQAAFKYDRAKDKKEKEKLKKDMEAAEKKWKAAQSGIRVLDEKIKNLNKTNEKLEKELKDAARDRDAFKALVDDAEGSVGAWEREMGR